jgi:hypothetical protein
MLTLQANEARTLRAIVKDAVGQECAAPVPPAWSLSADATGMNLTFAADNPTPTIASTGEPGKGVVTVTVGTLPPATLDVTALGLPATVEIIAG